MPDFPSSDPDPAPPGDPAPIRALLDRTQELVESWEPVVRPEGPADWFDGAESMAPFDPAETGFSASHAWWLAELCRLAYTPDLKEAERRWHRDKPARDGFLTRRTPFRELLNLHKSGNHVSLYRIANAPGAILCFRGTNKLRQWIMNLTALPVAWSCTGVEGDDEVCVHQGFQILFDRVWPLLEPALRDCDGPLTFTGHSLGGAFATLAALASPVKPASLVTFGSPRVGNQAMVDRLAGLPIHRIVNHHDLVALLPQREPRLGRRDFRHVGDLHYLGEKPGVHFTLPGPESPDDPAWQPPDPIGFLRGSLRGRRPPECLLDHATVAYVEKLRALAEATGSP